MLNFEKKILWLGWVVMTSEQIRFAPIPRLYGIAVFTEFAVPSV
jgi:hypothetical protein